MVNTREIAEEYRLSYWVQVMEERQASRLSIKAFCQQIGICQNTYFYWQRRVRTAVCEDLPFEVSKLITKPQGRDARSDKAPVSNEPHRTEWVALCEAAEPKNSGKALPIEIGKFRVLADADTDAELLAKVCKTLMSLC